MAEECIDVWFQELSFQGIGINFLRVDSNKAELFQFLFHALIDSFDLKAKQLVITVGESILSNHY